MRRFDVFCLIVQSIDLSDDFEDLKTT